MYREIQNIDDRELGLGVTEDLVGVNGIDPARQGIDPFWQSLQERPIVVCTDR